MVESDCESCGWIAAILSIIAFGSFGAPIKSDAANSVDIDPLVFQSYKTFMCFVTSWIVLFFGQEFTFTPWGIVSGLFWVPGGVATVYAVRTAGLAIAIGIGSSFIVLVSFIWGIFIFDETVRSRFGACVAVSLMMTGLWGMSYYSSPETNDSLQMIGTDVNAQVTAGTSLGYQGVVDHDENDEQESADSAEELSSENNNTEAVSYPMELGRSETSDESTQPPRVHIVASPTDKVHICGFSVTRRKLGIAAAVFNRVWGGSIMVPMQWSGDDAKGIGYVISFSIGASIITLILWLLRFLFHFCRTRSTKRALHALPSLHIRVMWLAGGLSGTLWSIGNFFSMISVEYLGEGVGYSVVQTAMLVSGLWGIFYFREVVGTATIGKWFASAFLTICGILLLSYEHHKPSTSD